MPDDIGDHAGKIAGWVTAFTGLAVLIYRGLLRFRRDQRDLHDEDRTRRGLDSADNVYRGALELNEQVIERLTARVFQLEQDFYVERQARMASEAMAATAKLEAEMAKREAEMAKRESHELRLRVEMLELALAKFNGNGSEL